MKNFLEYLNYDAMTGMFTWAKQVGSVRIGSVAGSAQSGGYRQINLQGKSVYTHRLAWFFVTGEVPQSEIDHLNGIRDDNRFCNLREVTRRVNVQNQHNSRKKSGLMGVWKDKRNGRWITSLTTDGVVKRLGTFATESEAHHAYLAEKRLSHVGCTL